MIHVFITTCEVIASLYILYLIVCFVWWLDAAEDRKLKRKRQERQCAIDAPLRAQKTIEAARLAQSRRERHDYWAGVK
jgi:hypothetical protein